MHVNGIILSASLHWEEKYSLQILSSSKGRKINVAIIIMYDCTMCTHSMEGPKN